MEKYDEDLNTTLIFVSFASSSDLHALTRSQAGLFSAVTSAFIIEVHSHLQQDPNDVTAALLRVLLYKMDSTTFGNDVPTLPQWTGPPSTIVHVQAILLASLATSLLSAFLAMLGKQWLNRYASTDMRGSAIERSQNRQRKLDGIVTWYFDHVMEALPLMLQIALLLLGCALSRYLWKINIIIASVVLGVTSFGMIFYGFVIVAGAASVICPYQTPGARILRHIFYQILPHIFHKSSPRVFYGIFPYIYRRVLPYIFRHILLPPFRSVLSVLSKFSAFASSRLSDFVEASLCRRLTVTWFSLLKKPWHICTLPLCALTLLPFALITDVFFFVGGSVFLLLVAFWMIACSPVITGMQVCGRTVYRWFLGAFSTQIHGLDRQTIILDLRCISWMLQTSLDKAVHLSALKHLATMMTLGNFDPTLVSGCFDVFIDCIKVDVNNRKVVITQGLEQLATVSAMCFLRTYHHLSVMNPNSVVLEDVRQRYRRVFSPTINFDFSGLPFYYTMTKIHSLANRRWNPRRIQWGESRPSAQEWISFTRGIAEVAQEIYQRPQYGKAPRWILRFALHSLSLEPLPPTSVVADCLSIIAIDLGCDVSSTGFTTSDERCVRMSQMTVSLTLN
jgi:hypothetical protein